MYKIFLDTNILVYSMDAYNKKKRDNCRRIIKKLHKDSLGVISTQIMQEFFVTMTKKLKVEPLIAKNILHSFENFEVVTVSSKIINEAIDCSIINQLSFWDSLIICSADSSKCKELWTEDLQHSQVIRGVRIHNPFNN